MSDRPLRIGEVSGSASRPIASRTAYGRCDSVFSGNPERQMKRVVWPG